MAGVDDGLLRIGDFSRASGLSVKALRAYHESGLLVPAVVDPRTGYRSYRGAQLTDAAVIQRLRGLDVPLAAVKQVLDARDPEVTKKVLADHGAVLEGRIAAMRRAVDELYEALEAPAVHTPVDRRREPAASVLAVDGVVRDFEADVERARRALTDAAQRSGAVVAGPFTGCFGTQVDDDVHPVTWALPIADPPPLLDDRTGVRVDELPACDVAVLVHRGPLDSLGETYRHLGTWVAASAESADLPVREVYVAADRTDLCWPIIERGRP